MRIDLWQRVLEDLEDCRAATLVTSTDFAKAFNRLFFQQCLDSFASHGASSEVVRLLATFLTNRKMSVRVQNDWSVPRPIHGGIPHGSILGVFLFNVGIDKIEGPDLPAWG